jgi:hypothetical protein
LAAQIYFNYFEPILLNIPRPDYVCQAERAITMDSMEKGSKAHLRRVVGRGHPPPEHRFAPGISGNAAGRPKGALGLKGQLRRHLLQTVQLKDGNSVQAVEAIARTVIDLACGGDLRAVQLLLSCSPEEAEQVSEPSAAPASREDDDALIDDVLLSRNMKNQKTEK